MVRDRFFLGLLHQHLHLSGILTSFLTSMVDNSIYIHLVRGRLQLFFFFLVGFHCADALFCLVGKSNKIALRCCTDRLYFYTDSALREHKSVNPSYRNNMNTPCTAQKDRRHRLPEGSREAQQQQVSRELHNTYYQ